MMKFWLGAATAVIIFGAGPAAAQVVHAGRPAVVIGSADGDSTTTLFGAFSAVRLSDGRIVVVNGGSRDLRIYDERGRHQRNIGREGDGPGEFRSLERVGRMRGDTIVAYDVGLGRITYFTPDGTLASSVRVQPFGNGVLPSGIGFLDDGRMLARTDFGRVFGRGERRDTVTFALIARDGTARDTLGAWPGLEEFHLAGPEFATRREVIFGRDAYADAAGRFVVIGSSDSYDIDVFLGERHLRTWSREFESAPVAAADVRALNDEFTADMDERFRQALASRIDEFPARETHPAFTGLLAGRDGSLWVRRSTSPRTATQVWDVYPQKSQAAVTITFPRTFTLLDAGAGYALGRFRDELGIEYIHVYDIPGGGE